MARRLHSGGSVKVSVRLPRLWAEGLVALAGRQYSVSAMVQDAVKQFLKRNGKEV
jgi:hypothetical protein